MIEAFIAGLRASSAAADAYIAAAEARSRPRPRASLPPTPQKPVTWASAFAPLIVPTLYACGLVGVICAAVATARALF